MSAVIRTLFPRFRRPHGSSAEHVYTALLLRDDVSIGDLMHALRFSGIVVSTDPVTGQQLIHRPPPPKHAA